MARGITQDEQEECGVGDGLMVHAWWTGKGGGDGDGDARWFLVWTHIRTYGLRGVPPAARALLNHGEEGAGRSRSRHRWRSRRRCCRCWRGVGAARVRPLELYPVLHFAVVFAFLAVVGVLVAHVVAVRLVLRHELPRRVLVQLPDDVFWLHSKHISGQPASVYPARNETTKGDE